MSEEKKLTKKQLKAQQFKKSKDEREQDKIKLEEEKTKKRSIEEEQEEPLKKKRKTRRGRKGKGKNGTGGGNRFIVFVGGLPRDITPTEIQSHFKSSSPDHIRLRSDKGIAFLEFDAEKDKTGIQRRMDVALLQHRTLLKEKRINVELTVGGGGNSKDRLEKLNKKNIKLDEERKERLTKLIKDSAQKKSEHASSAHAASGDSSSTTTVRGLHPDRAKLLAKQ
ncbi:Nop6p NDAI_0H03730 [Naumovozyma dairenensis CBS 421]|uniref:RRM domain-containing protein n=1 Tax=Naumovozyma dairenensis (strain ATCC 10597 / BCRC 20456 / CBS 421 / NBRC 0211 / NRRL Y-12639) TaxID=1071378 RepID=G0WFI5_NAUDC|nr:hypothetical protein NDAI_0H03730 [Naumovozyma dairenensis CBS 421]CCD26546.1 hypothetical protein NDAI_0H03730 [Naumovozyma dairenensis CBS 421]